MSQWPKLSYSIIILCLLAAVISFSGCTDKVEDEPNQSEVQNIGKEDIVDKEWQWSQTIEVNPESQTDVTDPGKYTLIFSDDGTYSIKADCNSGSGSYTIEENRISIDPGPMTLAYCGEDSLDSKFLAYMGNVNFIAIKNDQLVLHLSESGDRMVFIEG